MTRVRWRLTGLSLLATVFALQPITSLFTSDSWFPQAVAAVALVAVVGVVMRATVHSRAVVVLVQLVVAAYAILLRFGVDTFAFLLPTPQTVELANDYGLTAIATIQKHSAPAPLNDGITFWLVVAAALVAVAVDAAAATWRSPAAAGLPLLTAYLITAANGSDALPPTSFLVPVLVWLVMLHVSARSRLGRWGTTSASSLAGADEERSDRSALWSLSTGALRFGSLAVLAALVIPAVLPHFPPHYFADGLARSGGSGEGGTVGFNDTLDLTRSLQSTDRTPVLRYSTTGLGRTPLRALATSVYSDGEWLGGTRSNGPDQPLPLPPSSTRRDYILNVSENTLQAPRLAVPYPVVAVSADGIDWNIDPVTRDVRVNRVARDYQVTYSELAPAAEDLRQAGAPNVTGRQDIVPDDLAIPGEVRSLVQRWADDVTQGKETNLDRAIAIQDHLRDTDVYTYNLDLGPPLRDSAGRRVEPIRTFYETRRGYCVQFASAMVFLARAQGIPARMAIGFLPGTRQGSSYLVRASDAHAWPELYFEGSGWIRFEPTPGGRAGSPPSYAIESDDGTSGAGQTPDAQEPTSTPTAPDRRQDDVGEDLSTGGTTGPWFAEYLSTGDLISLSAVLVGLLGASLMPLTAWFIRLRRRRAAASRQELIEVEWEDLTAHLSDLGLSPPPGGTLRQWREHVVHSGHLDDANATVMDRVTATLERSRYDRPERTTPEQTLALHRDIRSIRRTISRTRALRTRLRSFFWPSTAVAAWRRLGRMIRRQDDGPTLGSD
ncbi:MAG TPA: transglutaminaseTgpA domain-containing protein [Dermatophilaceae bacterium]|nr:transglutaminaseTgpA domain-containing protein [Dermatophilaceae bacterium]